MTPPSGQRAPGALERRLLDAARREGPRESARRRTMLAVAGGAAIGSVTATSGATAAMGAAGSAKATAGVVTLVGVAKALAVGAISGAVVLGAAQKIQSPRDVASPPASQVTVSETRSAPKALPVAATRPEEPPVEPTAAAKVPAVRSAVRAPVERPTTSPPSSFPSDDDATSLVQEIALLDRARESLLAGDPRRAIAVLDAYEQARVGTRLAAEATLLRIEALLGSGEQARAVSLASEFLRAHPESPVADRMRAILHDASP